MYCDDGGGGRGGPRPYLELMDACLHCVGAMVVLVLVYRSVEVFGRHGNLKLFLFQSHVKVPHLASTLLEETDVSGERKW